MLKLFYKRSYLTFFNDSESNLLEMVSGEILDKEIVLPENISIGMTLANFVKIYSSGDLGSERQKIKIVKLISGLDGIWEYYTFKQGVLNSIRVETDYTFSKN